MFQQILDEALQVLLLHNSQVVKKKQKFCTAYNSHLLNATEN